MSAVDASLGYVVPSYRADDDEPWYHFLHGNVPGHQIDFMYRADVPQGRLTRQHFSHLARLMKYIEPQTNAPYAFAIGNLSRDDTQHEPGHGGLALIFGLRIRGATDHAGRRDPPFSHAVAAIDRELDATVILAAARAFHRHVTGAAESADWYRSYVRCAAEAPAEAPSVLAGYVERFADLPRPADSAMTTKWLLRGATPPRRIVIAHEDDAPFEVIARCAARIAAMLYQSDVRWTAISSGREADVPNGVSVRLLAESALGPADEALGPRRIADVPEDEGEIARQLFGASPAVTPKQAARGWRERYSEAVREGDRTSEPSLDLPRTSRGEGPPPPARARSERASAAPAERAASPAPPAERQSFDDAPTLDAPLRRASSPEIAPASRPDGAAHRAADAAGDEVDVAVDDDGERRASFDLRAPGAPADTPPHDAPPDSPRAPMPRRETVALTAEEARKAVDAAVLPFRAPAPPPGATSTSTPAAVTGSTSQPPEFRAPVWKWLLAAVAVAGVVLLGLYLAFDDARSPPPSPPLPPLPLLPPRPRRRPRRRPPPPRPRGRPRRLRPRAQRRPRAHLPARREARSRRPGRSRIRRGARAASSTKTRSTTTPGSSRTRSCVTRSPTG